MKNGCRLHDDCETCPYDDCKCPTSDTSRECAKRYYERHKEEVKRKRRERYHKQKEKKMNEQRV